MLILKIILCVLLVLLAVILFRTMQFKPVPQEPMPEMPADIDEARAVESLQKLVQCATVSYYDRTKEDEAEFAKLLDLVPQLYPHVVSACEKIDVYHRALLYRWKGKDSSKATVLMAHFDVVPVEKDKWLKDPFAGIIEDGVMWGRGTLDTKSTFNGILMAADVLLEEGFVPEHDIYLAFSGGEETNGDGAVKIVEYLQEHNVRLSMVLDEGGAVVEDVFPGLSGQCALIGIAEKGMVNVRFDCDSAGGHASAPKPHTPIGILAQAVTNVENNPLTLHISEPVRQMFDTLGRHSTFLYRMIFANLWCFKPVLNMITKKSGGELNALLRTTVAFTQARGGEAVNVIPPHASVTANIRINPEETVDSVLQDLRQRVNNEAVIISPADEYAMNPSPISRTDVEGWQRVVKAVRTTWGNDLLVAPYLMVQCSDSRHYKDISDRVYKFSAMHMTKEERGLIHGNNERITLPAISQAVRFFYRIIRLS